MSYERAYVEAMITGDVSTMRAIERLNRNDYSFNRHGRKQYTRDHLRALFGRSYDCFYEDPAGSPSSWW